MAPCRQCGLDTANPAYCSRRCAGLARTGPANNLVAWTRRRSELFHGRLLADVLGRRWRSGDPVTLPQLLRLLRASRAQGYHAAYYREARS